MPDDFATALAKSKAPKAPPAFGEALAMARGGSSANARATPDQAATARAAIFGSADPDAEPAPDEMVDAVLNLQGHGQRVEESIAKWRKELDRESFPGIFKASPSEQALAFERMGEANFRKAERDLAVERMGGRPTLGRAKQMLSAADSEARAAEDVSKIRQSENPVLRYGARLAVGAKEQLESAGAYVRENIVRPFYPEAARGMDRAAAEFGMSEESKATVRQDTAGVGGDIAEMVGQTAAFIPQVALGGVPGAAAVSTAASGGDVMAGVETAAFLKTAGWATKLFGGASESVIRQVLAEGGGLTAAGLATRLGFHGDPGTLQQAGVDALSGLAFGVMGGGARAREAAARFKSALEMGKTLDAAAMESGIPAERLKVPPVPESAWMREGKFETAKDVMPLEAPGAPKVPVPESPTPGFEAPILTVPDAPNLKRGKSGTKVMAEEYARAEAKAPVDEAIRRFEERTGIKVTPEPSAPQKPVSVAPKAPAEAPRANPKPVEPAVPEGMVRFYHGGVPGEGARWVSPSREYAEGYAAKSPGGEVQYLDLPRNHPLVVASREASGVGPEMRDTPGAFTAFEAPAEVAAGLKRVTAKASKPTPPTPPVEAPKPTAPVERRVVTADDLPDARGTAGVKWYHGTGTKGLTPESLDTIGASDPQGLVGMGLYLTDSPQIAETYAATRGRRTGTPTVYEAQVSPRNVLNFERPLSPDVAKAMSETADGLSESAGRNVREAIAANKSGMDVYKAMREGLIEDQIPVSEATESLQDLQGKFRNLGYDAISHIGGLRAGKGDNLHRVLVVLDPNYGYSQGGKFVQPYDNPVKAFTPKAEAKASAQPAAIEPAVEAPKAEVVVRTFDYSKPPRTDPVGGWSDAYQIARDRGASIKDAIFEAETKFPTNADLAKQREVRDAKIESNLDDLIGKDRPAEDPRVTEAFRQLDERSANSLGRAVIENKMALVESLELLRTVRTPWANKARGATEVEARPVEAPAAKVAPVVKELMAPPAETTMLAGGPEAISNKAASIWRGVRDTASEGVRALRRFFTSQKAPELLAMSPKAWRHVVKADAAPQIARAAFDVWRSEVPDKAWSPQDAAKFEAVLTENNRLGAIDARKADAAAKLQEAAKASDPKAATRLRREAAILTERAKRAEGKNEYVIGPDKPFATRQELLDFAKRPDVVEAAGRHAAWWKEMIEPRYRASVQADPSVEMPGRGRFFDARASLVAEKAGETPGVGGVTAGKTENLRVRKSRFARTAFGDASAGYKTKAEEYIPTALTDVIPKGEWRAAVDTLVKDGHGVVVKPNEKPPETINGERAMPFDIGPGNGRVYLPNTLHDLLYHIRQTAPKSKIPVITDLANKATSESMSMGSDNIFHIFRSMGVVMSRPSSGSPIKEAAANFVAWPVMRALDFGRLMKRLKSGLSPREGLEMAEAGVRERGDMYQRDDAGNVVLGKDGKPVTMDANIVGLRWLGKFGSAMDKAGRAELYTTVKRMKKAGLNVDDSPEAISRFVGQMGRYGRAWYGAVQRGLTDTGLSPFFEAWRNARGNAGRSLTLESALTPKDRATAIKLRTVMLSKLAGLFTTAGIINTLTDGSPFGQADVPAGAIVLHRDKETGNAITFDFLKMVGIRAAMNAMGVTAALDTARNGGTMGQFALRAAGSMAAESVRPVTGPLTTAASIAATGSRPDQVMRGQFDGMVPAAATEGGLIRRRTVEAAKAMFPLHGIAAEYGARWFGGEYIRDILNAGSEVTPDMMDELSEMLRTASINRTVGVDKAETYAERSKMGYLFGTYLDAVKADIRKAPPDKIQSVVEKALADIDAREDLDSASKAKAKKAVQMYAASRGRGR